MIKKLSLILFVSILIFSSASLVFAVEDGGDAPAPVSIDLGTLNPLGDGCKKLDCVLYKIMDVISLLVMIIMPFMVLWGAFQMMTAGGDPKKFHDGGKTILYASIGFMIALLAKNFTSILLDVVGQSATP